MAVYGYHRVSTEEQRLDRGEREIRGYCAERGLALDDMFLDKRTGKTFDRPEYRVLRRVARGGDRVIFTEVDRIGRDKKGILEELRHFREKGVRVMILELPSTLAEYEGMEESLAGMLLETVNNMLLEMAASLAHAEMIKREKRQREGMEAKKLRGEWADYGRPPAISRDRFAREYRKVAAGELRPFECMRALGLKKSTYYRYAKLCREENAD